VPLVWALPQALWAKAEPRAQPKTFSEILYGGAEPRLTSGGEAGVNESSFRMGA